MTLDEHIDALWRAAEDDEPNALLVLADAMEEAGDPLAAGIRWLGKNGKRPAWNKTDDDDDKPWWWLWNSDDAHGIPKAATRRLRRDQGWKNETYRGVVTSAAVALVETGVAGR